MTYAIKAGGLAPAIYIGTLNRAGTAFESKRDATDEVLLAVADYVRDHFNGGLKASFRSKTGGPDLTVEVRVTESAPQSGAETPADDLRDVPEALRPADRRTAPPEGTPALDPAQQIHDHENGDTR